MLQDDKHYGAIDTNIGTESLNKPLKYSSLPRTKNMTLTGLVNTIDFGAASGEGTPSCSCKDWTRWHIPCKHFFAVFWVKPEWSWNTIPKQYIECAYLSTDNEALVAYFSSQGVPEEDILFPPEVWHTDSPKANLEESIISDTCNSPLDVDSNPQLHSSGSSEDIECEIPKKKVIVITGSTFYQGEELTTTTKWVISPYQSTSTQ